MAKEEMIEMKGVVAEVLPDSRYRVTLENGHSLIAYTAGKMRLHRIRIIEGDKVIDPEITPEKQPNLTTWYAERAVKFIERNKDRPFFFYLAHNMPHVPLHVSAKFRGKSAQGLYGDVIEEIDWSVGEVLKALEHNNLSANTLVIFTSDNGGLHVVESPRTPATYNRPFRAGKGFLYEGGVRIPLIVADPSLPGVRANASDALVEAVDVVPTQLGGGIRTIESIAQWFEAGVKRVILGTVAVKEPGLVKAACKQWPGQVAVGIDAREGIVAVDGWTKQSTMRALDLALRFEDAGVSAIIYTDIDRDGAMGGVNIDATITLAQHLTTPVIASGGVSSLDDLRELRPAEEYGIVGAIVGRALYDGRVTVPDAIRVLKGE